MGKFKFLKKLRRFFRKDERKQTESGESNRPENVVERPRPNTIHNVPMCPIRQECQICKLQSTVKSTTSPSGNSSNGSDVKSGSKTHNNKESTIQPSSDNKLKRELSPKSQRAVKAQLKSPSVANPLVPRSEPSTELKIKQSSQRLRPYQPFHQKADVVSTAKFDTERSTTDSSSGHINYVPPTARKNYTNESLQIQNGSGRHAGVYSRATFGTRNSSNVDKMNDTVLPTTSNMAKHTTKEASSASKDPSESRKCLPAYYLPEQDNVLTSTSANRSTFGFSNGLENKDMAKEIHRIATSSDSTKDTYNTQINENLSSLSTPENCNQLQTDDSSKPADQNRLSPDFECETLWKYPVHLLRGSLSPVTSDTNSYTTSSDGQNSDPFTSSHKSTNQFAFERKSKSLALDSNRMTKSPENGYSSSYLKDESTNWDNNSTNSATIPFSEYRSSSNNLGDKAPVPSMEFINGIPVNLCRRFNSNVDAGTAGPHSQMELLSDMHRRQMNYGRTYGTNGRTYGTKYGPSYGTSYGEIARPQRAGENDHSTLDTEIKARHHSLMDKFLSDCMEQSKIDDGRQMTYDHKARQQRAGENDRSTLDTEIKATYYSQGARPKDSSFINQSKSSLANSDDTNRRNRPETTHDVPQPTIAQSEAKLRANVQSKSSEMKDLIYRDQPASSTVNPDHDKPKRRNKNRTETTKNASRPTIGKNKQNQVEIGPTTESEKPICQDQSKYHSANPDQVKTNRQTENRYQPKTITLDDKSMPERIHLPNHLQPIATLPKPSRSLYVVLLRDEDPVPLGSVLEFILSSDTEQTILSLEHDQILDIDNMTLQFPDIPKAQKAFNHLKEFQHQNLGVTWSPVNKRLEILKKYFNDFEFYPSGILKNHDIKIHNVRTQIETCAFDEKEALKIRKEELVRQLREFTRFSKTVRESLRRSVLLEDEHTFQSNVAKQVVSLGIECNRLKSALPIYASRSNILDVIRNHQVVIVRGETGSGKSTQLVQYLHQSGQYTNGLIACSQPRKVACVSLAERVADEMVTSVGQVVGLKAGMKNRTSKQTQIVYTTHHTLLNECLNDPMFQKYSCLMIDEVHERSIYTDILLSILKNCLSKRLNLKVVIASATIDVQLFKDYFIDAPVIEVSGRAFPVEIIWQPKYHQWTDPVQEVVAKAMEIHMTEDAGDILAFVTTQIETEKCKDAFEDRMKNRFNFKCLMLHGQLPPEEQALIFQSTREGQRKIIFSTNSAETSLTIPGIKFVIDSGLVKEMQFDARKNMNTLVVVPVSRSSADQRKGRAGRISPGKCFRLYTERDYRDMKPTSTPEILRIHLSQTLLMLYEMNLKPSECEFVESPSDSAIRTALETLEELGSIKDDQITDIGKWLVKIPLEPRFGCMIKKGYEMGFVYDTIVFTALCSSSGSIFYRGGNDQQKKKSDLKKLQFCESRGDAFTFLKIYKEWDRVPENRKNKWCFDNALNSKSLRGARELVKEICSIFKHNWSIEVKKVFSTDLELEEGLQKIILFAFYENIAHSLGHIRMGYYIPNLKQRVFVHPSSALNSLNDSSQWLVFINILKTSRDYITVVTPVEESWIRWATLLKTKQFDIDDAKNKSVCSVRNQFFGSTTYSFFVGPAYTKLKAYEDLLYESVQVPVVIEADRKTGEVKFICGFNATLPDVLINAWISEAKIHVVQRSAEYKVGSNIQAGGVRIVLGLGGEGQIILMPDDYRTVHIKSGNRETTKETVMDKFKEFGEIVDCWEDKRSYHRWGRVTFSTPDAAAEAVRKTHGDPMNAADPEFKVNKNASYQYQATIEWLRRRPTGLVFVDMDYMEAMSVKALREVRILGHSCSISLGKKKQSTVLLHNVPPMVTEQDILYSFPNHSQRDAVTNISIIREKKLTSPNELPHLRQQIQNQFQEYDQSMKFIVDVMKPYDSQYNFKAFIKFTDVSQGTLACDALRGRLTIDGQKAIITPKLSTSLSVPERVYQLLEDDIEDFLKECKENGTEFKFDVKKLNNDRRVFNISASNSNDLVQIRMGLAAIIQGEIIECWRNENYRFLFLKSGREFLRRLENESSTILQLDNRLFTLRVFGMEENINLAQNRIDQYLGSMVEGDERRDIKLDGESQPKGLMKTLVTRYDLELEGFVQESGLHSALLIHHNQTLKICGDSESLDKATGLIESLSAELRNKNMKQTSEGLSDCCVCMCPVERMDHLYRLDACGHAYCLECIKQQLTVAIKNKDLPILCGECEDPLVWSDFQFGFKRLQINPLDLVRTTVSVYMAKNKDGYRHCLTADCPMVYRVTEKSNIFNCNECGLRICTSCHVEYHDGLTCAMLNTSGIADLEMEKYLRENPNRVKKCPKCSTPIEKKSGCNRMICLGCKIHFCWLCCKTFKTSKATYKHLSTQHNGIDDL